MMVIIDADAGRMTSLTTIPFYLSLNVLNLMH
jgi:hypothetical protein